MNTDAHPDPRKNTPQVVLLDRDGTLCIDVNYATKPEQIVLCADAAWLVASLKRAGFLAIVVSNQSAVARGLATVADVDACNAQLQNLLIQGDAEALLDLFVYATEHPENATERRKPGTGMLEDVRAFLAARGEVFSSARTWMIGNRAMDLEFARNAGIAAERRILVDHQTPAAEKSQMQPGEILVCGLREAGSIIVRNIS